MVRGRWQRLAERQLLVAIVGAQIVLALAGIVWWQWERTFRPGVPDSVAAAAASMPLPASLEGALPAARERALAWRDGALLVSATAQVDWPLSDVPPGPTSELPPGGWLIYVFVAPWDHPFDAWDAATLTVRVERSGGTVQVVGTSTWPADVERPSPLAMTYPVSSTEAALRAEAAEGAEFRRACPLDRHTSRVSPLPEADGTAWLVSYTDVRAADDRPGVAGEPNDLEVTVDAASGAVRQVVDLSRSCDATT